TDSTASVRPVKSAKSRLSRSVSWAIDTTAGGTAGGALGPRPLQPPASKASPSRSRGANENVSRRDMSGNLPTTGDSRRPRSRGRAAGGDRRRSYLQLPCRAPDLPGGRRTRGQGGERHSSEAG